MIGAASLNSVCRPASHSRSIAHSHVCLIRIGCIRDVRGVGRDMKFMISSASGAKVKEEQFQIPSNDKSLPCYIPKFVQVRGYCNFSAIFETIRSYSYFYEMPCFI